LISSLRHCVARRGLCRRRRAGQGQPAGDAGDFFLQAADFHTGFTRIFHR